MENNIDKLFKSKLGDTTPYDPAAWGRMAALIDEDEDVNGGPILPPRNRWKIYLGITLLLMISVIGFWQFNMESNSDLAMKHTPLNDKESWSALNSDHKSIDLSSLDINSEKQISNNSENQIDNNSKEQISARSKSSEQHNKAITKSSIVQEDLEGVQSTISRVEQVNSRTQSPRQQVNAKGVKRTTKVTNEGTIQSSGEAIKNDTKHSSESDSRSTSSQLDNGNISKQSNGDSEVENYNRKSPIESEERVSKLDIQDASIDDRDKTVFTSNDIVAKAEENKSRSSVSDNESSDHVLILNPDLRKEVLNFPFMNTITSDLENDYKEVLPVSVQVKDNTKLEVGVFSTLAFNKNYISQTGINVGYKLNRDWSLYSGLGFEFASYYDGGMITVQDKLYSFGSTFVDRNLELQKRTAAILPISIERSFGVMSLRGGISVNYHIAANGSIDDGDGSITSIWVTDDVFRPLSISYAAGALYDVNRNLKLIAGIIYRPSEVNAMTNSQGVNAKLYPTVGLNYIIAKY